MDQTNPIEENSPEVRARQLADRLTRLTRELLAHSFHPDKTKSMRLFSGPETASLLGVTAGFLRKSHTEGTIPLPANRRGTRRAYTAEEIWDYRRILSEIPRTTRRYRPWREEGEPLQVFQLMNFKGGCSKTTMTAHIAQYMALQGFRVLAIDMDPQGSLTGMCGLDPMTEFGALSIYDAIRFDDPVPMNEVVKPTFLPGLSIAPAQLILSEYNMDAAGQSNFHMRLSDCIDQVAEDFDLVFIDSPPDLGFLTLTGMSAASSLIIPMTPSMMDLASTTKFISMVSDYMSVLIDHGAQLHYDHFEMLITRDEPSDQSAMQVAGLIRGHCAKDLMNATSLKSAAISDATLTSQTLYEIERSQLHPATYDRARENMDAVCGEILSMINHTWGRN